MPEAWYVKFGDEIHGPISSSQLKQLARKGAIKPGLPVRRGQSKWIPAAKVRGLFEPTPTEEPAEASGPPIPAAPEAAEPPEPAGPPEPELMSTIGLGSGEAPALSTSGEALALPIDLHLDTEPHLVERPHRLEPVTEKPSEPDDQAAPAMRRRPYLRFEGSIRSIGHFFLVNALLALGLSVAWAVWILQRLNGMTAESNLREFYAEVLGTGLTFLAVISVGFLLSGGLRNLQGWARWATATLMIESIVGSLAAEILLAIVASPLALRVAVPLLFLGMLIPGYIAFVMLHREGDAVFSITYRDWAAQSPGLRPRRDGAMTILLLVEVVIVGITLYLGRV